MDKTPAMAVLKGAANKPSTADGKKDDKKGKKKK